MTVSIITTGKDIDAGFGTYDSGTATYTRFPYDTRIGTLTAGTNLRRLYSLNDRSVKGIKVQKFEGSVSIDMPLSDVSMLSNLISNIPYGDIIIVYPDFVRVLTDFVPQRIEVSIREDELVRLSIDGVYVDEAEYDIAGVTLNATDPSGTYPAHIDANLTTVDGVTNVTVRAATIRANLNNELKWGFNSRKAQAVAPKQIEVEVTLEAIIDKQMLDKVIADTQTATSIAITLNGSDTITVTDAYLDNVTNPLEPNTEAYATLTYFGKSINVS